MPSPNGIDRLVTFLIRLILAQIFLVLVISALNIVFSMLN